MSEQVNNSIKYFRGLKHLTVSSEDPAAAGDVTAVAWNPVGSRLAHARTSGTVLVADYVSGGGTTISKHYTLRHCHRGSVPSVSWWPVSDNVLATVGSSDSVVRIWDVTAGGGSGAGYQISEHAIRGSGRIVQYSTSGQYLATVSKDVSDDTNERSYVVSVFEVSNNYKLIKEVLFDRAIYSFTWANNDELFVVGFEDGTAVMYLINDASDHDEENITSDINSINKVYVFRVSVSAINALVYDCKGRYLIIGSHDGIISIWSLRPLACIRTISLVDEPVMGLDVSKDGEFVAATFQDGSNSRIYDTEKGIEYSEIKNSKSSDYNIARLAFRPKNLTFAYSTPKGEVMLAHKDLKGF